MKRQWFYFITCVLFWTLLVSGFTTSLRTDLPANDDDPTETPIFIRATRSAYQERLDVDHYFEASAASTYDDADTGKHRQVTFQAPTTVSSVAANEGALFTKDVAAIAELHFRDESENEKQLTELGLINIEETDIAAILLDEDDMASDSATSIASQQSIKAYADTEIADAVSENTTMVPAVTGAGTGYAGEESVTLPNGLIMKMGFTTIGGNSGTVTFSVQFPTAVVSVSTSMKNNVNTSQTLVVTDLTVADIDWAVGDSGMTGFWWQVIGY